MATQQVKNGVSIITVAYTDKGADKTVQVALDPAKCQHPVKARYGQDKLTCVRPPRQCSIARYVEDAAGEKGLNPLWALKDGMPTDGCNYHVKVRDTAHRDGKSLISGHRASSTAVADNAAVSELRALIEAQDARIEKLLALATANVARSTRSK